jgi:carboxyl-terminal processing protease
MTEGTELAPASPEAKRRFARTLKLGVAFALVLALGFAGGVSMNAEAAGKLAASVPLLGDGLNPTPDSSADLADFWKAWNVLNSRFVQTHASTTAPDSKDKIYGAIQGLAASFGDPYTTFFPPTEAKSFKEEISGSFEGVGMVIGLNADGVLTVISPLKDSPAEKAGLKAGDLILSIDGTSTEGLSDDEAVQMIHGPKGTTVTLKVARDGNPLEIKVVRETIEYPTIDYSLDQKTGVYSIALYSFSANSAALFDKAIADFKKSGSDKLLIDLRGNPGGYLEAAVAIASHFLPDGTVVVTEDYKGKQDNKVHRSRGASDVPARVKVAVLIDQGSASASEILAGALQDAKRATLIGTRSFGKGSVQELVTIGGGSLKVTVARWLTPAGRSISDGGLTPDIKAEVTKEQVAAKQDAQKARAVEFLATGK